MSTQLGSPYGGLMRDFTNAAELGIILIGQDGFVALWNEWMTKSSGIPCQWAEGRTLTSIFPELDGSRIEEAVRAALETDATTVLSSSQNTLLFPLLHESRIPGRGEPMHQIVVIKPLAQQTPIPQAEHTGKPGAMVQVFDVTNMAHRETLLRQQAKTMEALAENYRMAEAHNRAIVNNTADAILTFGEDGLVGTFNAAAETIFGYDSFEIVGRPIASLIPALGGADGVFDPSDYLDRRREVAGLRRSNAEFTLELSVSDMDVGGQKMYVAVGHDITERKLAEQITRNQMEWLTTLINALPDLVCFKDDQGRWLVANEYYLSITGLDEVDYRGRTNAELSRLSHSGGNYLATVQATDDLAWAEGKSINFEKEIEAVDGTKHVFDFTKIPLYHQDGKRRGLVLIGRDITERKLSAARINHLAHHDALTGLPNRVLFQDRLRQSMAHANRAQKRVGLLFLDLDKFKDINDTLGHHVGDLLLKAVARRLSRCVRETDTVVRLGGDEFAVILNNLTEPGDATMVADSIISAISDPFGLDEHEVLTSTSIGITIFPDDSQDAEQLLKYADLAMFRSKAEGRNNYHYYVAEMDAEVQSRKIIENDLRQALGSNQLRLHYQPLIDVKTGLIVGCEALLRWLHPESGWVSPADFIPVAERTDLIQSLGRWILHRACMQAQSWAREGLPPLKVAVNLSPAQFKNRGLVGMVETILDQTGMPASQLQLEITEGIAMHNIDATLEVLRQLRAMGAVVSIDDFGTGYSSLNYLKRFPVDKLKIDRSFVVDIGLHPDNAAVVQAIVNLGHSLGNRVNVEGVETQEQMDFLTSIGVDEAQGFLFSKALPPEDFVRLVRGEIPMLGVTNSAKRG